MECDISKCELLKLKNDFGLIPDDIGFYHDNIVKSVKSDIMRNRFVLERDKDSPFGRLFLRGVYLADTLENPDFLFPVGFYDLAWTYSPKFKKFTIEVSVDGRSGIRFHAANYVKDLKGCVGLGLRKDNVLQYSTITVDRVNRVFSDCLVSSLIVF